MAHQRMAAIDVGSNSIHMIIVEPRGRGCRVLDKEKEMVQLARGSLDGEPLTAEAISRGVSALEKMAEIARRWAVQDIVAVATSAVREAPNGGDFIERAAAASGIRVRVISGEEEADYIYRAIRSAVDFHGGTALCVDIGGGSIELVLGTESEVYFTHSDPLGAIRLAEKFFDGDPPSSGALASCAKHVRKTLRKTLFRVGALGFDFCIGSSGTITTIAELTSGVSEEAVASGLRWLDRDKLEELVTSLAGMNTQKRVETLGIDPRRADSILSGGIALLEIMRELKVPRLRACSVALREGLVDAWLEERKMGKERGGSVRHEAIADLAERSEYDRAHSAHVAKLALRIFDQTGELHKLGRHERELLEHAATLHEIGTHISFQGHHRHTYYLIRHAGLAGFTSDQVMIVANVARYHRKAEPSPEHENFKELSGEQRKIVQRLSAILRVAAALDRSRKQAVRDVAVEVGPKTVRFVVRPRHDPSLEIESAEKRAKYFSTLFQRKVVFDAGPEA